MLPTVVAGGGAEQSLVMLAPHLLGRGMVLHLAHLRPVDDRSRPLLRELSDAGVQLHDLSAGPARFTSRARRLRRLVRTLGPDVVHSTILEADLLVRAALLGAGVPLLTTWANTSYDPVRRALEPGTGTWKFEVVRWVDMLSAHLARPRFHAVTEGVARDGITALHVPPSRVTVVERGRDLSRFVPADADARRRAREAMGVPPDATVLLCVARQFHQKGHVFLLRAFEGLHARHPEVRLVLVGPQGAASPLIRQELASMASRSAVSDLGERGDVADMLGGADLVVLPSVAEGAAGALLEAMAAGVPVVASRLAGFEGWLLDGEHALLARPGDPEDLERALEAALADPAGSAARARRARDLVRERFSIERSAAGMAELYRSVSDASGASRPEARRKAR